MESMFNHPTAFLVLILGAIAVDLFSGLTWWPGYFRMGIPLFVRKQSYSQAFPVLPGSKALGERFCGAWVVPLLFHRLSPTEIAVRERFWGGFFKFTYTPLVHGLLEVDEIEREIKIVGRANAFPLVFLGVFAVPFTIEMIRRDYFGIVFLAFLVGSLLMIQFIRYGRVLKEALDLMGEAHENRA